MPGLERPRSARGLELGGGGSSAREVSRMAVRKIAHPSVDDRKADGFGGPGPGGSVEPHEVAACRGPP